MQKRGQFFILGAIILALALFVLMIKLNTFEDIDLLKDFPALSENYKTESVKVVNDAIMNEEDENVRLSEFTKNYVGYARTIDPNLGFVYVYYTKTVSDDKIIAKAIIKNYLGGNSINVYPTADPSNSLFGDTDASISDVSLNVGGIEFKKTIPVYVKNFGSEYNELEVSGPVSIEVAGVFYDIPSNKPLTIIARSIDPTKQQVSVDI